MQWYKCPDTGELQAKHFEHQEYVFSDIFIKGNNKEKYITLEMHCPTTMQMHGMMTWYDDIRPENNEEPSISTGDCPKYPTTTLSKLLDPIQI